MRRVRFEGIMLNVAPPMTVSKSQSGASSYRAAQIAHEFDEWAPTYDTGRLASWYRAQALLAFKHLDLPINGRVLDIGCATGWALRCLARRRTDVTGTGIDMSEAMITAAQAASRHLDFQNLQFRQLDWEGTGKIVGPFDVILCLSTLHYFAQPGASLRRMRSLMSENGQLLIVERAVEHSILTRIWDFLHRRVMRDNVTFEPTSRLIALAHEAGFRDVRVLSRVTRIMWKNKLYTSLVLIEARA